MILSIESAKPKIRHKRTAPMKPAPPSINLAFSCWYTGTSDWPASKSAAASCAKRSCAASAIRPNAAKNMKVFFIIF